MGQYSISKQVQDHFKQVYEEVFRKLPNTASGFPIKQIQRPMMEDSEEERQGTFQALWDQGAFHFWRRSPTDYSHNGTATKNSSYL